MTIANSFFENTSGLDVVGEGLGGVALVVVEAPSCVERRAIHQMVLPGGHCEHLDGPQEPRFSSGEICHSLVQLPQGQHRESHLNVLITQTLAAYLLRTQQQEICVLQLPFLLKDQCLVVQDRRKIRSLFACLRLQNGLSLGVQRRSFSHSTQLVLGVPHSHQRGSIRRVACAQDPLLDLESLPVLLLSLFPQTFGLEQQGPNLQSISKQWMLLRHRSALHLLRLSQARQRPPCVPGRLVNH
mmetsp:Transcript_22666/g.57927  ORF Transcript_22666/g.57927 Transcript_22666/m.57927 type:complete len:242 (-) Transcript_22666:953-1678(-)